MLNYIEKRKKDSHFVRFDGKEQFENEIWKHLTKWLLTFGVIGDKKETPATVLDYEDPGSD